MIVKKTIHRQLDRYLGAKTNRISKLPVVILMPHSACNCRCLMCDIWKANAHKQQLSLSDIESLLSSFTTLETKKIIFSGGEALLHPLYFQFAALLKQQGLHITLLSTGLGLRQHAAQLAETTDEIIVSLDGDRELHDHIRGIPGAFDKIGQGVRAIRALNDNFPVKGRSVIHRKNFRKMNEIVIAAKELRLDQLSFFPADVSSQAFNREQPWEQDRQNDLLLSPVELDEFQEVLNKLIKQNSFAKNDRFIAESPARLQQIHQYYKAHLGKADFPFRKCNAPWVSTVIESDGNIRHCFFQEKLGNIREGELSDTLNNDVARLFRKQLDTYTNEICRKCVCTLYISPDSKPGS